MQKPKRSPKRSNIVGRVRLLALGLSLFGPAAARAATFQTLYTFKGVPDASGPMSGLYRDANGNLFGVTQTGGTGTCIANYNQNVGCGAVYELSPPAQGKTAWTEKLIYSFKNGSDGSSPDSRLIADTAGNLYGTADCGPIGNTAAGCGPDGQGGGEVFELSPPASGGGAWKLKVLYSFGAFPDAGGPSTGALVGDQNGNLYGTTVGGGLYTTSSDFGGTVYRLSPPKPGQTAWTETVLHNFGGTGDGEAPRAGLAIDAHGNLYGTTSATTNGGGSTNLGSFGCGTAFELSPPSGGGTEWTETILHLFPYSASDPESLAPTDGCVPQTGLAFDSTGALYGTTESGGTPQLVSGTIFDGNGTVFKLSPPAGPGAAWTETVVYGFTGNDGADPQAGVVFDPAGNLYGSNLSGGSGGTGTLYKLSPPASPGGAWAITLLQSFDGGIDGSTPLDTLVRDAKTGALFGVTLGLANIGTVFEVTP